MYGKRSGACHSPGHLQTFRSVDSSAGIQTRSDRSATSGLPLPAVQIRPENYKVVTRVAARWLPSVGHYHALVLVSISACPR